MVTVSNSANRDQTMSTRGNQSTPVQWSPVESTGLRVGWSPLDLPSGLESTGLSVWRSSCKTAKRPRPDRTRTDQDRKFSGPIKTATAVRSSVYRYFKIFKTDKNRSQPVFTALEAGYSNMRYLYNISTSKVMEVLDELSTARRVASENPRKQINDDKHC